jgi:hypothetical protein
MAPIKNEVKSNVYRLPHRLLTGLVFIIILCLTGAAFAQTGTGAWYKGDLHAHSTYSDGDSSVADVVANGESVGLDFFVITDHDTYMNGEPAHWFDPYYQSEQMVLLYGVEWTSSLGHANVWSTVPFSYGDLWQANLDLDGEAAVSAAHWEGALFSINHPMAIGCCPWKYQVYDGVDTIEVWNSMYRFPNFNRWAGHLFWDNLLNSGKRIPGVGGSDTHYLEGVLSHLYTHVNPTTWVYADDLSAEAVLAGISAGHASISYSPNAARLDFRADADNDGSYETMMGDNISESGNVVRFQIQIVSTDEDDNGTSRKPVELPHRVVKNLEEGRIHIREIFDEYEAESDLGPMHLYAAGVLKNGDLFRVWIVPGAGTVRFKDIPGSNTYYRIKLAGDPDVFGIKHLLYGRVVALINPIYVGYAEN